MPQSDKASIRGRYAVSAMFFVNGFLMGCFVLQIPYMLPRFGIEEDQLSLMILMLGLGAVTAMLFSGALIARVGSRRATILFALLVCPSLSLIALAPGIFLATCGMVALGAFGGSMDVAMNSNAVVVERRMHRAIMSSCHGFWSLGGFVGSLSGGPIIAMTSPAQHGVMATLLALGIVGLAAVFLISEQDQKVAAHDRPRMQWPKGIAVYLIGMLALFSMIPEGAAMDWGALYLTKVFGASPEAQGLGFALFSGAMATMRFAGDAVRNRFGAVRTLRISALIGAAGIFGLSVAPTSALAIACFFIAGIGIANMVPIAFSAAGNQPGVASGTGIAIATTIGYCGILLAPAVIGHAVLIIGYRVTYLILSVLLLIVALSAGRAAAADRLTPSP